MNTIESPSRLSTAHLICDRCILPMAGREIGQDLGTNSKRAPGRGRKLESDTQAVSRVGIDRNNETGNVPSVDPNLEKLGG